MNPKPVRTAGNSAFANPPNNIRCGKSGMSAKGLAIPTKSKLPSANACSIASRLRKPPVTINGTLPMAWLAFSAYIIQEIIFAAACAFLYALNHCGTFIVAAENLQQINAHFGKLRQHQHRFRLQHQFQMMRHRRTGERHQLDQLVNVQPPVLKQQAENVLTVRITECGKQREALA